MHGTPGDHLTGWLLKAGCPPTACVRNASGWVVPSLQTSPTNIAAYVWSVLAAERLKIIDHREALARLTRTLATLEGMERSSGFYYNDLDPRTGTRWWRSPLDRRARRRLAVNGRQRLAGRGPARWWPTPSRRCGPGPRGFCEHGFRVLLRSLQPGGAGAAPGMFHVGLLAGPAVVLRPLWDAQLRGEDRQLSRDRASSFRASLYFRLFRTIPETEGPGSKNQPARCATMKASRSSRAPTITTACGLSPVGEGHVRGAYGAALRSRRALGAAKLGRSITRFTSRPDRTWAEGEPVMASGVSPRPPGPQGGYQVYGVKALGSFRQGYHCHEFDPACWPPSASHSSRVMHGVVAPTHRSSPLRYAPREALANLHALTAQIPTDLRTAGISRFGGRHVRESYLLSS